LKISVAVGTSKGAGEFELELPSSLTLAEFVASGLIDRAAGVQLSDSDAIGVWGKVRPKSYLLRDGDRVEIYAPLRADPKSARRTRAARARQD
jgi:putative ubiquitin-RnfH superfamily antitoxin RatB of RatAB toxin-antitoxin module